MYLKEILNGYGDKKIKIYIDMDGVIADYDVGKPGNFDKKRPLYTSIDKLKEISFMDNVSLYILSITRKNIGIYEKNIWLDKYMPFIDKNNRFILSKEKESKSSSELKVNFLKNIKREDGVIILIDDDPLILKSVMDNVNDIVLLKDTVLVD